MPDRSDLGDPTGPRDRLLTALEAIARAHDHPEGDLLADLVAEIRPERPSDGATALRNLQALEYLLTTDPRLRDGLRHHLEAQFRSRSQSALYSELGILPGSGFFSELARRLSDRFLPLPYERDTLLSLLTQVFPRQTDRVWVQAVGAPHWEHLFALIGLDPLRAEDRHAALELLEAVQVISCRLAAIGLSPEIAQVLPDLRRVESAFVAQNVETLRFVGDYRKALSDESASVDDHRHILVLLEQCGDVIARVRRNTCTTGVNIDLTYLLQRAADNIARQQELLAALDTSPAGQPRAAAVRLFQQAVEGECTRNALRPHFSRNTELLARQVTEHSGRTGEHYITSTRSEYRQMFRAALGAGAIVPLLAFIKLWLHDAHAAPLVEGFLYGLNYAAGFILIHVFHFTLATKQPAMTASRLAAVLDTRPGSRPDTGELVSLIVRLCRSQFIAIVGNIALAMPLAFFICLAWSHATGGHVVTPQKAEHLLEDLHPLESFALFHAAIAGVYLFLSGLVTGYFDNVAVFRRVPDRLRQLRWLRAVAGPARASRIADYAGENLGGIAGNAFFGFMLGITGVIGFNLGLPLDIRHVTFAAANFSIGLEGLDALPSSLSVAWIAAGIALIGAVNLVVSFSLALLVAMRARRVPFRFGRKLIGPLLRRFMSAPLDFFRPPRLDPPSA